MKVIQLKYRSGVSLVELMIVIVILSLLSIIVLTNTHNTTEHRRSKECVRIFTQFIEKAKSRSLGKTEYSGIKIKSDPSLEYGGIDCYIIDQPLPYRGETIDATFLITGTKATGHYIPNDVKINDLIRFDGLGFYFKITSTSYNELNFSYSSPCYNSHNCPLPANCYHSFEIVRLPVSLSSLSIDHGRCVDLFWSGVDNYKKFSEPNTSINILFDGAGQLKLIIKENINSVERVINAQMIYFLIGKTFRVSNLDSQKSFNHKDDHSGANWQYNDSYWVAIEPRSGIIKSAECYTKSDDGIIVTDVIESQKLIRQHLLMEEN